MSVADVQGIPQAPIHGGTTHLIQPANRCWIQGYPRIVSSLLQLITPTSSKPCSGPTSTSERVPRVVRVIGVQLTVWSTAFAASRVSTQTCCPWWVEEALEQAKDVVGWTTTSFAVRRLVPACDAGNGRPGVPGRHPPQLIDPTVGIAGPWS